MKIAIILLYGIYTPDRKDYQKYLDFIASELTKYQYDKAILCGGYTNPNIKNISEASSAKDYLRSKTDYDKYILEDKSINSNQNLEFASKFISKDEEITVYCDLIRVAKIFWMSAHFLLNTPYIDISKAMIEYTAGKDIYKPFIYRNLKVVGFDFEEKSKEEMIGQSFATAIDIISLYDEEIEKLDIKQRKKDFGLS